MPSGKKPNDRCCVVCSHETTTSFSLSPKNLPSSDEWELKSQEYLLANTIFLLMPFQEKNVSSEISVDHSLGLFPNMAYAEVFELCTRYYFVVLFL